MTGNSSETNRMLEQAAQSSSHNSGALDNTFFSFSSRGENRAVKVKDAPAMLDGKEDTTEA
jgi:hypothetical protein